MANKDMIQSDLASGTETSPQQMEELLQPLLSSSQPADLSSQQHVEDDDEVTIDIKEMIHDCGDGLLLPDCCIYRVPTTLRQLKEDAYSPKVISIGPFHHLDERLKNMENHKRIMFKRFTRRARSSLEDLVRLVKHLEPKVRASYSETINFTEQELVKLTITDAGFIIELFLMRHAEHDRNTDAKLSQEWLYNSIILDLILLENQLPFFVIEELFDKAFPQDHDDSRLSFLELTFEYFAGYNSKKLEPNPDDVNIKHFTDLIRLFYLQRKMAQQPCSSSVFGRHHLLYSANELHEAGIKFKAIRSECLLDLKFSGHTLEIPQLVVEDSTELLFRNMMALEQCHYPNASYISDYALVFDFLIDTHKDVNLLVHKEIVSNCLGDPNRVALLFNGLSENFLGLNFNPEYLDICQRLNVYCRDPRHKMIATLRRDYCNTPWHTVASIAGIILLVLTIVQTIFSILQVVLKK